VNGATLSAFTKLKIRIYKRGEGRMRETSKKLSAILKFDPKKKKKKERKRGFFFGGGGGGRGGWRV
jgi:hypothetical protein